MDLESHYAFLIRQRAGRVSVLPVDFVDLTESSRSFWQETHRCLLDNDELISILGVMTTWERSNAAWIDEARVRQIAEQACVKEDKVRLWLLAWENKAKSENTRGLALFEHIPKYASLN
jgi:hypothetical protein